MNLRNLCRPLPGLGFLIYLYPPLRERSLRSRVLRRWANLLTGLRPCSWKSASSVQPWSASPTCAKS